MKKHLMALTLATAIIFAPTIASAEESDSCDCEFEGLKIATAVVEKVWSDNKGHVFADTKKASDGFNWTVMLVPQHNEGFEEMVVEYTNQEIGIGYVGDDEDAEVVWALLTSVD